MQRAFHIHTISPVYDERSRVLLLGSFPSSASRACGFFYGHPQNRMWRVLAAVTGQTQVPASPAARKAFLLRHHIAMWDVLASCTLEGASDASIQNPVAVDIRPILDAAPIKRIFTCGVTATRLYRHFILSVCGRDCERLPSTSSANAAYSFERLVGAYRVIIG